MGTFVFCFLFIAPSLLLNNDYSFWLEDYWRHSRNSPPAFFFVVAALAVVVVVGFRLLLRYFRIVSWRYRFPSVPIVIINATKMPRQIKWLNNNKWMAPYSIVIFHFSFHFPSSNQYISSLFVQVSNNAFPGHQFFIRLVSHQLCFFSLSLSFSVIFPTIWTYEFGAIRFSCSSVSIFFHFRMAIIYSSDCL